MCGLKLDHGVQLDMVTGGEKFVVQLRHHGFTGRLRDNPFALPTLAHCALSRGHRHDARGSSWWPGQLHDAALDSEQSFWQQPVVTAIEADQPSVTCSFGALAHRCRAVGGHVHRYIAPTIRCNHAAAWRNTSLSTSRQNHNHHNGHDSHDSHNNHHHYRHQCTHVRDTSCSQGNFIPHYRDVRMQHSQSRQPALPGVRQ